MNFSEDIIRDRELVMADFYADWCEPCKWAEPVIAQVLNSFEGKIVLEKINIDHHPDLAKSFHVLSVPTFILFENGKEVWRKRGFDVAPKMTEELRQTLK